MLPARSWNRRPWAEAAALSWLVVVAVGFLAPALSRGSALGPYDILHLLGVTSTAHQSVHNAVDSDELQEFIAWQALAWHQVHAGVLPLWDRFNLLGMPYGFNFESAPFSLTVALGYAFPLGLAHTATIAARLVIAGSGAYVLGRMLRLGILPSVLGATVFELSGAFTIWVGTYQAGCYCFLGWVLAASVALLRARRRALPVSLLAVALALAFTAGEPQVDTLLLGILVVFVGVVVVGRVVRKDEGWNGRLAGRMVLDHLLALVAGAGLAAPMLLPSTQLLLGSARSTGPPVSALAPHEIIHLLFASYNGVPTTLTSYIGPNDVYVSMVYVGAIALVLALVGLAWIRRRPEALAFAVLVAGFVVALFFPPVVTALSHIPELRVFRLDLATTPMDFSFAMLAAFGAQALLLPGRRAATTATRAGTTATGAARAATGAGRQATGAGRQATGAGRPEGSVPPPPPPTRVAGAGIAQWADWLFVGGTVFLAITLGIFEVRAAVSVGHLGSAQAAVRDASFLWPMICVAACAVVAIARALVRQRIAVPRAEPSRPASTIERAGQELAGRTGMALLVAVEAAFCIVSGGWFLSSTSSPLSPTPAVAQLERAAHGQLVGIGACVENAFPDAGIMPNVNDAYGVLEMADYDPIIPTRYYSSYGTLTHGSKTPLVPHVFCPQITSVRIARAYGVRYILEPVGQRAPAGVRKVAVVHGEVLYAVPRSSRVSLVPLTSSARPGSVLDARETVGGTWHLRFRASTRSKLILRVTAVPGWQATIDGKPLTLRRVDTVLLEATVPAGTHDVVLHYWPELFTVGLIVCGITGAALVVALSWSWRTRRRRTGAAIETR